ncbi:MAG TPA: hypothetical protein VHN39_12345 [Phenylobacterium sp.]|jgi:hypothetical protein|nr:hypothetical protein [Phenylobacterium sp.]
MNRTFFILAAALAASSLNARAAPPAANVATAFGNTVVSIDPDGRSRKIWLQPDGSWTGLSRRGLALAGKWTVKGEKICMSQSKPRLFGDLCQVFPSDPKTGIDTKDPTGTPIHLKLVKGHIEKYPA